MPSAVRVSATVSHLLGATKNTLGSAKPSSLILRNSLNAASKMGSAPSAWVWMPTTFSVPRRFGATPDPTSTWESTRRASW